MDELRQVRELAQDAPGPDPERKARARDELLQLAHDELAADEQAASTGRAEPEPARRAGWVDRLATTGRGWLRPAPAAGLAAAAVAGLVGAGVLLSGPADDPPPELADPDEPTPEPTDPEVEDPEVEHRDPTDPGAEEPAPEEPDVELAASCEGPDGRITVDYPDGWYTPQDGEPGACRFFGEDPFDVDAAIGGAPLATLEIAIEPAQLDGFLGDEPGLDEQERDEFEGTDRRTVRQRLESTGEAMLPDGALVERYLVDLDGDTLIVSTQADDADTLDDRRGVLEAMIRSIEVDDG